MKNILILLFSLTIISCMAPRTIINSGKVTPKGQFRLGGNFSGNISSQASKSIFDAVENTISGYLSKDSIKTDATFDNVNEAVYAYTIDPIKAGFDVYARYGLIKRLDLGYKYAGGVHVLDAQYQFLGSTSGFNEPSENKNYGSIAIQYSSQNVSLPSKLKLDKLQDLLGYSLKRKDILIPLILSHSFGEEEKYGSFSYGAVLGYTSLKYGLLPSKIYKLDFSKITATNYKKNYMSVGGFLNIKAGYKYAYLTLSLAVYYQKYGEFELLSGNTVKLKGLTLVPSAGLQLNIWKNKKKT